MEAIRRVQEGLGGKLSEGVFLGWRYAHGRAIGHAIEKHWGHLGW